MSFGAGKEARPDEKPEAVVFRDEGKRSGAEAGGKTA